MSKLIRRRAFNAALAVSPFFPALLHAQTPRATPSATQHQETSAMQRPTDVLLAIDLQNDFMPGGALAVARGDEVVPLVNRLAQAFTHVVLTQDWHPADHVSFAAKHPGRQPFDTITLPYGQQTLWPTHCVQGSRGAELHTGLQATITRARAIVRKGQNPAVDSYSAFVEADRKTRTGLAGYLRELGVTRVYYCGLATDYCVAWSALDARAAGFEAALIEDASRAIDLNGSLDAAWQKLRAAGVTRVSAQEVLGG